MTDLATRVPTRLWVEDITEAGDVQDVTAHVEIEQTEPNEYALHTFVDGKGSLVSFYFDRESVLSLAARILKEAALS